MSYFRCQITSVSIDNSYNYVLVWNFHHENKIFVESHLNWRCVSYSFLYKIIRNILSCSSDGFTISEFQIPTQMQFQTSFDPIISCLVIKQIAFCTSSYVMYGFRIYLYIPSMYVEENCKFMNVYWSTFTRNSNVLPICFKNRSS